LQGCQRLAELIVKLARDRGPFTLAQKLQVCREGPQLISRMLKLLFRLLQTHNHDVALTDNRVHLMGLERVDERFGLIHPDLHFAGWWVPLTHRSSPISRSVARTFFVSLRLPNRETPSRGLSVINMGVNNTECLSAIAGFFNTSTMSIW